MQKALLKERFFTVLGKVFLNERRLFFPRTDNRIATVFDRWNDAFPNSKFPTQATFIYVRIANE